MSYAKTEWVNSVYDDEGNILRKGTPLMAENMNKIENKLEVLDEYSHGHENWETLDTITRALLEKIHSHLNKDILDLLTQAVIDDSHKHENKLALDLLTKEHIDTIGEHSNIITDHEQRILTLVQGLSNLKIQVVKTIAERNSLENKTSIIHVIDATEDLTVESGWAQYIYQEGSWIKIAEKESLDIVLKWADIIERPTEFKPIDHGHEISEIANLQEETVKWNSAYNAKHDHLNISILDLLTQAVIDDSHMHENKSVLEKVTQRHLDDLASALLKIASLEDGSSQLHTHLNKLVINKLTQEHLDLSHGHSNKDVLDKLKEQHINSSHTHDNKNVIEIITQELLEQIHSHNNKSALDKISYSGSKISIDLINLDELENHTHSYGNLDNKPDIPSKTSQLTNDSSYLSSNASKITVSATAPVNPKQNDIWIVI